MKSALPEIIWTVPSSKVIFYMYVFEALLCTLSSAKKTIYLYYTLMVQMQCLYLHLKGTYGEYLILNPQ